MKTRNIITRLAPVLLAFFVLLKAPHNHAATLEAPWKAGVASVVITPDQPMWMAGYASRTNTSRGKAHDLYAKALALDDTRGTRLVIVTLDLIGVPRSLRQAVEAEVTREHGLARENLLMNCSHTHSGPEFRMGRGPQDWAMFGKEATPGAKPGDVYGRELTTNLVTLVRRAIANSTASRLAYQHARCGFAMNRRTPFGTNYNNFPNPDGPVDHDVPVLRVEGMDGKLRAVLFGYACHNTTLALYQWSGDYAGFAQQYFEKDNPGVTAMFMEGCGGDQNPYPRGTLDLAQQHGRALATAVEAALQTRPVPLTGPLQLAYAEVDIAYDTPPTRAEFEARLKSSNKYEAKHARRFLDLMDKGEGLPKTYSFPVQVAHFGNALTFVGLPGETVVDYALRLKHEMAGKSGPALWIAGYCNDVMGYVPSARLLREGGYEPHSSVIYSEIHPAPWHASVEERIIGKVHALNAGLNRNDR